MKTILTTGLLMINIIAYGQRKLDITIIGTVHHFKAEYKELQDFQQVQDFIINLDPDIICIEAIPTHDTASLREVYSKTMKHADELCDTIAYLNNHVEKVKLGGKYFTNYDFWNAYYYWFQAACEDDSLGYFSRYYKNLSNSEYGLIVYPAAKQLGVSKLYGIDYRAGEDEFMELNGVVMKKLLFGFKWKPLGTYLKIQKQYKKAEKAGTLVEFINGKAFQQAFSNLIDELPQELPKSEEAVFIQEYWAKRNQIMAERIIATALEKQANKVLLTVGSAHVTHIKRFIEEQGHAVRTYGDFVSGKIK